MPKKDLFIHAIQQIEVRGSKNIPTAIFYKPDDEYLIGYEALEATENVQRNEDGPLEAHGIIAVQFEEQ
jgi:hypothetical protein